MGKVIPYKPSTVALDAPAESELADDALVAAIAAGDRAALGLLYDRYARALYGFLGAAAGVRGADLDDLVHDTFLAAFEAAPRFSRRSAVRTWLFGIAVNISRNHVRRAVRRRRAMANYSAEPQRVARPDEQADSSQQLARLAEAIAELPVELRLAYVTSVLEGLPGDEAARALGVRKGTLWRRVHEARERLREQLERSHAS